MLAGGNLLNLPRTVEYKDGKVILIDQRLLPERLDFFQCEDVECVAYSIKNMVVRGAPAIGATAAYGLALRASQLVNLSLSDFMREMEKAAELLRSTRPTAINLFWAIDKVMTVIKSANDPKEAAALAEREARRIAEDDVKNNMLIGEFGSPLIADGFTVMTICNAGSFATVWYGTATAPIYKSMEEGKRVQVIALETRPVLQGARITAFELSKAGIPVKVIVDGAAGYVMSEHGVDLVITGADRVLSDGTVFNKIGTYSLSVLAKEHGVPFYVAAPTSTFDLKSRPEDVIIEIRDPSEVKQIRGIKIAPDDVEALNPAFDRTPPENITGIITERGVLRPPFKKSISQIFSP